MRSAAACVAASALAITMLEGCGGKSTPGSPTAPTAAANPIPPPSVGAVDSALVGTWNGSVDGSFGYATLSIILGATGALTTVNTGGASAYCAISGEWGVDAGRFTARGADCTGTIVTLTAPATNTRLSGTCCACTRNRMPTTVSTEVESAESVT